MLQDLEAVKQLGGKVRESHLNMLRTKPTRLKVAMLLGDEGDMLDWPLNTQLAFKRYRYEAPCALSTLGFAALSMSCCSTSEAI